jgi:vacuolar protein sorting-associated protein 11
MISRFSTETEAKKKELEELNTKPVVFQGRRCMSCGGSLDLPTIHFLCKHSFHQRCLNAINEDVKCPVCAPQHQTIKTIRKRQVETAERHDLFQSELRRSKDRFGFVSEFFGRGVMGRQKGDFGT